MFSSLSVLIAQLCLCGFREGFIFHVRGLGFIFRGFVTGIIGFEFVGGVSVRAVVNTGKG